MAKKQKVSDKNGLNDESNNKDVTLALDEGESKEESSDSYR